MRDHGRRKLEVMHKGAEIGKLVTEGERLVFVEFVKAGLDDLLGNALAVSVCGGTPRSGHNKITAI